MHGVPSPVCDRRACAACYTARVPVVRVHRRRSGHAPKEENCPHAQTAFALEGDTTVEYCRACYATVHQEPLEQLFHLEETIA